MAGTETVCVSCQNPLYISLDIDSDDDGASEHPSQPQPFPDDVHLQACGCHFHWDCLMEDASTDCPNCQTRLITTDDGQEVILCAITNEGGMTENENIWPQLKEENHFKMHPEAREAHAFFMFCQEGDMDVLVNILKGRSGDFSDGDDTEMDEDDDEEDEDIQMSTEALIRYQDPFNEHQTPLHAAIIGGHEIVAWLLLYLGSDLDTAKFPKDLLESAIKVGFERDEKAGQTDFVDVRHVTDQDGRKPKAYASQHGGPFQKWAEDGLLD